jgi:8-oxo-dGTP diphosphatase
MAGVRKKKGFVYSHPRPMITVDVIAITERGKILLVKRRNGPFKGYWAIPGGFMEIREKIHKAALRELKEETGLSVLKLSFFGYYDAPDRDPRGRSVTFVYYAVLKQEKPVKALSDAREAFWFDGGSLPRMAFDHKKILRDFLSARADDPGKHR